MRRARSSGEDVVMTFASIANSSISVCRSPGVRVCFFNPASSLMKTVSFGMRRNIWMLHGAAEFLDSSAGLRIRSGHGIPGRILPQMDYRRTYVRELFELAPGTKTSAYGWVKTRRDSKGISFVQLNDGSCFKDLQIIVNEGVLDVDTLKKITTGACVRFDGQMVESPAAGQPVELVAKTVEMFGEADPA